MFANVLLRSCSAPLMFCSAHVLLCSCSAPLMFCFAHVLLRSCSLMFCFAHVLLCSCSAPLMFCSAHMLITLVPRPNHEFCAFFLNLPQTRLCLLHNDGSKVSTNICRVGLDRSIETPTTPARLLSFWPRRLACTMRACLRHA